MNDIIKSVLANADAFRWLFFIALLWVFYRWMQGENGIEWRDFISARGADGQFHGDTNKLGQCTGIVIGSWSLILVSANAKSDFIGFAAVLGAYFAFVGCVAGYAAYLRSKATTMQTTVTTEPADPPMKTTTKTVEPVTEKKGAKK
ncbi:MAG: hypothetical protein Q7N50_02890 [Armatimonadota bacterium]|nr:hypothetical protein [Armatimonadota bacterium]